MTTKIPSLSQMSQAENSLFLNRVFRRTSSVDNILGVVLKKKGDAMNKTKGVFLVLSIIMLGNAVGHAAGAINIHLGQVCVDKDGNLFPIGVMPNGNLEIGPMLPPDTHPAPSPVPPVACESLQFAEPESPYSQLLPGLEQGINYND
jgi:hypothetical protein